MEDERLQQMEKRLNDQAEAIQAINETLNKFITIMSNQEAAKSVAPSPSLQITCNHPSVSGELHLFIVLLSIPFPSYFYPHSL
jgi:hypothetical protein